MSTNEVTSAALDVLDDGRAWHKFQAICEAQGALRTPPIAAHRRDVAATVEGVIVEIDNRRLAKVAKLAGAPRASAAGIDLHARVGDAVTRGMPLLTLHAEARGELAYALDYFEANPDIVRIGPSS